MKGPVGSIKTRILFVDDNEDFLASIQTFVESGAPQWRVDIEADPVVAIARLRKEAFDVVVADYRMPRMDGLRFLDEARRVAPQCRRVLITAHPDAPLSRGEQDRLGIALVLLKPVATGPFMERLRRLLGVSGFAG